MGKNEAAIQSAALAWLKGHGFWAWRCSVAGIRMSGGRGTAPNPMAGHPDIGGILPGTNGRYFAIEVKAKGGRFLPRQVEWATRAKDEKVFYLVAYSLADVIEAFREYLPSLTKSETEDAVDSLEDCRF